MRDWSISPANECYQRSDFNSWPTVGWGVVLGCKHSQLSKGCEIVLGFFFWAGLGFFLDFLAGTICLVFCNGLELEFVILHGICPHLGMFTFDFTWDLLHGGHVHLPFCMVFATFWHVSPSILHGISYMWACSPSILYGICHILACSPSILHGMFYMWACSLKYLQMRKLGIR